MYTNGLHHFLQLAIHTILIFVSLTNYGIINYMRRLFPYELWKMYFIIIKTYDDINISVLSRCIGTGYLLMDNGKKSKVIFFRSKSIAISQINFVPSNIIYWVPSDFM